MLRFVGRHYNKFCNATAAVPFLLGVFVTILFVQQKKLLTMSRLSRVPAPSSPQARPPLPLCPDPPPNLLGKRTRIEKRVAASWQELRRRFPSMKAGFWQPPHCRARSSVAVIMPYRNRDRLLRMVLQGLHPMLQRQLVSYRVFVIDQVPADVNFNRGALLNVGFVESRRRFPAADCIILHDVDLLPEDDRTLYRCKNNTAEQLSSSLSKFNYERPINLAAMFGGVVAIGVKEFVSINGLTNLLYGWGGEDNDFKWRARAGGLKNYWRTPLHTGRFFMFPHGREKGNHVNPNFGAFMKKYAERRAHDGVNSVRYTIRGEQDQGVAQIIQVQLPDEKKILKEFQII